MLKRLEFNYREIANLANVVKQAFDDIANDYREKSQSRVTMLIYVRTCKGSRNNRDVFARQESTTPEQEQLRLPGTILIGQDRGRIEHVRSNYRSKRNVRPRI